MDDPGGSTYFLGIICLTLSAIFSCSESVLLSSDYIRLKSAYAGHKSLQRVLGLKDSPQTVVSGLLLGNTLVNIVFASTVSSIIVASLHVSRDLVDLVATLVGTVLLILFGEITPKLIGTANPESILMRVSAWLRGLDIVMKPVSGPLGKLSSFFSSLLPKVEPMTEELNEARLLAAVDFGETSGAIRNDEKEMIHGVIDSHELDVTDVMVPRPDMVAMQEDRSVAEGLNLMLRYGFSRIPVFQDTRDNITGIVNIKDLMGLVGTPDFSEKPLKAFAMPPYFVPETKNVRKLLHEMQSEGIHMSIVVDEYNGVSGLVTLEDLVEEIVGEIRDEYDSRETGPVRVDGGWEVPGQMSLADLESSTGIAIDMEDCGSVAGVVMWSLDRVPVPGDVVYLDDPGIRLEVKDAKGPRVRKVLILVEKGENQQ
ncbi:MAG: hemolysin family protein [Bacillota bacterium]